MAHEMHGNCLQPSAIIPWGSGIFNKFNKYRKMLGRRRSKQTSREVRPSLWKDQDGSAKQLVRALLLRGLSKAVGWVGVALQEDYSITAPKRAKASSARSTRNPSLSACFFLPASPLRT